MTRLRTCEGINLEDVKRQFGDEAESFLMRSAKSYMESGKLETVSTPGGMFLKLTENGVFVSDEIISDLMNPD